MHNLSTSLQEAILKQKYLQSDPISLFVYDLAALQSHVETLMNCLPKNVELYYAIKANNDKEVLDTLAPWVNGFEISSGGEIAKVVQCDKRLPFIFSGPGKLDSELKEAIQHNVEAIHIESLNEIARVQSTASELNKTQQVFIRINPSLPDELESTLTMAGRATPFGIDEADLAQAVKEVDQSENLLLKGFHIHAMSHQKSLEKHKALIGFYLTRWREWKQLSAKPDNITHLNVGGGIGVNYTGVEQFDWESFCNYLDDKLCTFTEPPVIRFEPGRFITAFCGYYAVQVLDIKSSHGQKFVVCRGGTHQFRLPSAQNHDHPIIHLACSTATNRRHNLNGAVTVCGQLCTPKDVLSRTALLPDAQIGDILVLPLAGAYGYNISHVNFLCHPRPKILFLSKSEAFEGNR